MGTPDFAVGTLEALEQAGHEVVLAVTQPDKPQGRKQVLVAPPVKEKALELGIPVFQPKRVRESESLRVLKDYEPELIVVAAFGQILPKELLDLPKYGCINVHASLLPKYRGAAPIQWAILNGDPVTGVTIMQMNEGMDTGDILTVREVPIQPEDTGESLFDKLSVVGAELLVDTLPLIEAGKVQPVKQDEESASHVRMLTKEMGKIDWTKDADALERLVRGMNSWPSAFCRFRQKNLKVWKAQVVSGNKNAKPGEVIEVYKDAIVVQTGKEALKLLEVQMESKKRMAVKDFLLGYQVAPGECLG